jgi:hypothetical protein
VKSQITLGFGAYLQVSEALRTKSGVPADSPPLPFGTKGVLSSLGDERFSRG